MIVDIDFSRADLISLLASFRKTKINVKSLMISTNLNIKYFVNPKNIINSVIY